MAPRFDEEWAINHGVEDSSDLWGTTLPSKDSRKKREEIVKDYDTEWKKYLKEHPSLIKKIWD